MRSHIKKLSFVPYDFKNKIYARKNRMVPTYPKKILWKTCLSIRPLWYKFLRQKLLWNYIADFYCSALKLVIEVDWVSHEGSEEYDKKRDGDLTTWGIITIRYDNEEVLMNLDKVIADISERVALRAKEKRAIKPTLALPWQGGNG